MESLKNAWRSVFRQPSRSILTVLLAGIVCGPAISNSISRGVGPYELVVRDASAIKGDGPVRVAANSGKEGLWNP